MVFRAWLARKSERAVAAQVGVDRKTSDLGKVDVSGEQDQGRRGRIIVRDPSPPPGQLGVRGRAQGDR